jgi:hypothetical protein
MMMQSSMSGLLFCHAIPIAKHRPGKRSYRDRHGQGGRDAGPNPNGVSDTCPQSRLSERQSGARDDPAHLRWSFPLSRWPFFRNSRPHFGEMSSGRPHTLTLMPACISPPCLFFPDGQEHLHRTVAMSSRLNLKGYQMRKFLIATAMVVALPAFAVEVTQGAQLGKTMDEVKAGLVGMGYEVRKVQMEDGKIEAYAVMGKTLNEVYVDPATGLVTKILSK